MTGDLYFAYGANLNRTDWNAWCVRRGIAADLLRFASRAYLPDHDVRFSHSTRTGGGETLNIVRRPGQVAPGVLFEVDADVWPHLDEKEGHPGCYERFTAIALDEHGRELPVETYRVCRGRETCVKPTREYVEVVQAGLSAYGLPTAALEAASKNVPSPWLVDALFVYGTLMRGESRFVALEQLGFLSIKRAQTFGRLLDLGSFPGLVHLQSRSDTVKGELVRLRDPGAAVAVLDAIEEFRGFGRAGSLYRRTLCEAVTRDGRSYTAWTYCLAAAADDARTIRGGDWRNYCGRTDEFAE